MMLLKSAFAICCEITGAFGTLMLSHKTLEKAPDKIKHFQAMQMHRYPCTKTHIQTLIHDIHVSHTHTHAHTYTRTHTHATNNLLIYELFKFALTFLPIRPFISDDLPTFGYPVNSSNFSYSNFHIHIIEKKRKDHNLIKYKNRNLCFLL